MTSVPRLRDRFIKRAQYLQENFFLGYHDAIAEMAAEWNSKFPRFEIGPRGAMPAPSEGDSVSNLAMPHRLAIKLDQWQHGVLSDLESDDVHQASFHWDSRCQQLAIRFLPHDVFPSFDSFNHVARFYTSHCLVFRIETVAPRWFFQQRVQPQLRSSSLDLDPSFNGIRAELRYLWSILTEELGTDSLRLEEISNECERIWQQAFDETNARRMKTRLGEMGTFYSLPIPRDATADELRAGLKEAMQARRGVESDYVADAIRRQAAEGRFPRDIALNVGLEEDTVKRVLKSDKPAR